MVVRPTSKHSVSISRAADSLVYILKSEQEQCLKKFVADNKDVFVSLPMVLVSLSNTHYTSGRSIFLTRIA